MKSHNYPKHWDGHISLGGKMSRQLDAVGLPYLKKSSHDGTLTRKHDDMYTVTGGVESEFWTTGTARKNGENEELWVETPDYRHGFRAQKTFFMSYAGRNWGFGGGRPDAQERTVSIAYGPNQTAPFFDWRVRGGGPTTATVSFGDVRARRGEGFDAPFGLSRPYEHVFSLRATYIPTGPATYPLRNTENGIDLLTVVVATGVQTDRFGAPTTTPLFYKYNTSDPTVQAFTLPDVLLPAGPRRSAHNSPTIAVVGPNKLYVLMMHNWTYPTQEEGTLTPVARLFYSETGLQPMQVTDVSADLFADVPWTPLTAALQRDPSVYAMRWFFSLNLIWATARATAIGNDEALLTYVYERRSPHDPTQSLGLYGSRTHLLSGGRMTLLSDTALDDFSYLQHMVYLGNDVVLAKRTYGFPGIGHNIELVVSQDRGVTWEVAPATGLPNLPPNRKNQFFGEFTVVEPISEKRPGGVVLLTAYDPDEKAYYVYESRDIGAAWRRRGLVARTERFFRVDQMLVTDGGGHFETVRYVGSRQQPAPYNPAIPDLLGPP